ncbi:Uricase (urate oxidase) / 2-oxo-4-hydroxy-4-carboxy-5-ureidoimidazoline (OHCU) decarboxylase [hydrothermal vent metagenome]|uniref:Uricase (Urate oxidase) / 2-oxo-4-hydroxy-4-carboxy-5-ureidoimidazoline (OHCU) decarboxylase n=1 Tax=hydrothermal vent metagenome TaxID=652676 RepID=A0A3B0UP28_9ZZZZ
MRGYGKTPPHPHWPNDARIALQFVLNYEEGGENNILHGDEASEAFLSEIVGAVPWPGQRHWNMESIYEYGARAGFWRLHDLFTTKKIPITVFGVATALARSPEQVAAMQEADWEIASHGLKWIEYKDFSADEERDHMREAIKLHTALTGERPLGWYTGRCSVNTVDLATELDSEGPGFAYLSDAYDDDLPYWREHWRDAQLIIPYTLDANDMRFATPQGFNSGDQFFDYLKDSFDALYAEGQAGAPKMMSIGLHCRLAGRPGRFAALRKFVDYVLSHEKIWIAKRIDIARHWEEHHPYVARPIRAAKLMKDDFLDLFGSVFENSEWVAERTFDNELGAANNTPYGLFVAMRTQFRLASDNERLEVLKAHPDLAGKLAAANHLTKHSTSEQASAGLDHLSDVEREKFLALNRKYVDKFGFPFIIAARDHDKASIIKAFETRLDNDRESEFLTACSEVERIAQLRIMDIIS